MSSKSAYKYKCKPGCSFETAKWPEMTQHLSQVHSCTIEYSGWINRRLKRTKAPYDLHFYAGWSCSKCGNKFSSSLCHADMTFSAPNNVSLGKIYRLSCKRCKNVANPPQGKWFSDYLVKKMKLRILFEWNAGQFSSSGEKQDRVLIGHEQSLCEKCKALGEFCGVSVQDAVRCEYASQTTLRPVNNAPPRPLSAVSMPSRTTWTPSQVSTYLSPPARSSTSTSTTTPSSTRQRTSQRSAFRCVIQ